MLPHRAVFPLVSVSCSGSVVSVMVRFIYLLVRNAWGMPPVLTTLLWTDGDVPLGRVSLLIGLGLHICRISYFFASATFAASAWTSLLDHFLLTS